MSRKVPFLVYGIVIFLVGSCTDFYTEKDLEACKKIVTELTQKDIKTDTLLEFYVADLMLENGISAVVKDSASQAILTNTQQPITRGMERGHVYIYTTNTQCMVFITTYDNGHAGQYGYGYSSQPDSIYWNNDNWGEFWEIDEQLSPNWWKVYFALG